MKKAMRFNKNKLRWSLVDNASLAPLVQVLMYGAKKYALWNWTNSMPRSDILDSMRRHLNDLMDGEEYDKESKLHHVGHIMANAMFYSFHYILKKKPRKQ